MRLASLLIAAATTASALELDTDTMTSLTAVGSTTDSTVVFTATMPDDHQMRLFIDPSETDADGTTLYGGDMLLFEMAATSGSCSDYYSSTSDASETEDTDQDWTQDTAVDNTDGTYTYTCTRALQTNEADDAVFTEDQEYTLYWSLWDTTAGASVATGTAYVTMADGDMEITDTAADDDTEEECDADTEDCEDDEEEEDESMMGLEDDQGSFKLELDDTDTVWFYVEIPADIKLSLVMTEVGTDGWVDDLPYEATDVIVFDASSALACYDADYAAADADDEVQSDTDAGLTDDMIEIVEENTEESMVEFLCARNIEGTDASDYTFVDGTEFQINYQWMDADATNYYGSFLATLDSTADWTFDGAATILAGSAAVLLGAAAF